MWLISSPTLSWWCCDGVSCSPSASARHSADSLMCKMQAARLVQLQTPPALRRTRSVVHCFPACTRASNAFRFFEVNLVVLEACVPVVTAEATPFFLRWAFFRVCGLLALPIFAPTPVFRVV